MLKNLLWPGLRPYPQKREFTTHPEPLAAAVCAQCWCLILCLWGRALPESLFRCHFKILKFTGVKIKQLGKNCEKFSRSKSQNTVKPTKLRLNSKKKNPGSHPGAPAVGKGRPLPNHPHGRPPAFHAPGRPAIVFHAPAVRNSTGLIVYPPNGNPGYVYDCATGNYVNLQIVLRRSISVGTVN